MSLAPGVVRLENCTWTSEVDDVFAALGCEETSKTVRVSSHASEDRYEFKGSMKSLLEELDLIFLPLLRDEELEDIAELPIQAR